MGLFDLFSDAKENIDKSRQAREYIRRARELVRDGDDIYERAYSKTIAYANETEYILYKHNEYKKNISKELGNTIKVTLNQFKSFNIDSKVVSSPTIDNDSYNMISFKSAVSSCITKIDTPSIFDIFISDDDYYEARRQRDEARLYKERMKAEREKLNGYKEKMRELRFFVDSEKQELDSLMEKIKKMNNELKIGMQKKTFTAEESEYLKGINKIAQSVVVLLSTEFLSDNFSINEKYTKIFKEIKNINNNIPCAPSISDPNTMNGIRKILGDVIVY